MAGFVVPNEFIPQTKA